MRRSAALKFGAAASATLLLAYLFERDQEVLPVDMGSFDQASLRQLAVIVAQREMNQYGGRPRVGDYWQVSGVNPPYPSAWCGAFVLWCLKSAGIVSPGWQIGLGFVAPANLHTTSAPQPGDVMYRDQPWQHYGIVVGRTPDGVQTIEGNTPGIRSFVHPLGDRRYTYYSIDKLLSATV